MTANLRPEHGRSKREHASAVLATRALRPMVRRLPRWPGLLILNYHRVGEHTFEPWDHTLWNADAAMFDAQVRALVANADLVAAADIAELARTRRRGRMVLLTFDDGYRDNYEIAYPILRQHGGRATFMVSTGFLDRPRVPWWDEIAWMVRRSERRWIADVPNEGSRLMLDADAINATIGTLVAHYKRLPAELTEDYLERVAHATGGRRAGITDADGLWMSWEMVREMRDAGMDIGGHTVSHPILARLPEDEQIREVRRCGERLCEMLGAPMRWFAYPVGSRDTFTPTTRRILSDHGVELAFSFYGGFASFENWDPLDVPRMHVPYGASGAMLQAALRLPMVFARPSA